MSLSLLLLAAACSSSNEPDAARDADVPDGGTVDAASMDAEPFDAAFPFRCLDSVPPTRLVEDFCRTPEGMVDFTGTCMEEHPSGEY